MNERTTASLWSLGNFPLTISQDTVRKTVDKYEAQMLVTFTDVFPRVTRVTNAGEDYHAGYKHLEMERLTPLGGTEIDFDLIRDHMFAYVKLVPSLLKKKLWCTPPLQPSHPQWRDKLNVSIDNMMNTMHVNISMDVREQVLSCDNTATIHGDPTLANTVWENTGKPRLIDPVYRPYIPSDPHVDLGKIFQSLIGWELMLLEHWRGIHELDRLPPRLIDCGYIAKTLGLDYRLGFSWCVVHLMRAGLRAKDENMLGRIIRLLEVAYAQTT